MKALICGIDLTNGGSVSQILSHERAVRATFEAFKPAGWTSAIVVATNNTAVAEQSDVEAVVSATKNGELSIPDYIFANPPDLVIMSYVVGGYYYNSMARIPELWNVPLFMPMPNKSPMTQTSVFLKSNIVLCGGGSTENIQATGVSIEHFDLATNRTGESQAYTSYTTAVVAARAAWFLSQGLTHEQMRKAIRYNASLWPDFNTTSGWGKITGQAVPESYELEPPQSIRIVQYTDNGVQLSVFNWVSFLPQTQDGIRIYANDELIYQGNGSPATIGITPGAYASASTRSVSFVNATSFSGPTDFKIRAYLGDVESRDESYTQTSFTYPVIPDPDPEPEPEPPPPPAPPPEPEPELPPVNPTPDIFITRTATALTATNDGGGETTEWQYRTDISAPWSASVTTDTLSITPDPTATYQLRTRVTSGDITTEWVEAFATPTEFDSKVLYFP